MTQLVSHARSAGVRNPMLDLFDVPPTDLSLIASRHVPINPFTTGVNPIDFQIDPQEDFIDLNNSYFEVELRMKLDNGTDMAVGTRVTVCNNLVHSIFKQINVRLNGTLISPQTDTYHHKAFLNAVMYNDRDDGETILKPEGWFNALQIRDQTDNAATANQLNPAHADFAAMPEDEQKWIKSRTQFLDGKKVIFKFKPYLEVFHLSKLLVPGVQIQIQMYLNPSDIWSQTHGGERNIRSFTNEDISVKLFLNQKKVEPSVYRSLMTEFTGPKRVTYPTVRSEIRTYNHAADQRVFEANNIFHGQLPNRVVVALLDQTAFNGHFEKYPFSYKPFNLTSIKQLVRGEEYPYTTLELDHANSSKDYRGYHRFLQATECLRRRKGNMVRPEDWGYGKNCTLFVFDNTANGALSSAVLNPVQSGEVSIVIRFGADPGVNLTVLVYGEFENLLEINSNKVVTYDVYRQ